MSLLLVSGWFQGDGLKVAVFLAFVAAFFLAAKWSSAASQSSANPTEFVAVDEPHYLQPPAEDRRADAPMHPEMRYGDVLIRALNFKTFDALPGPPDPTCFCDEILLELENLNHGHKYMMSYVVATPEGLRKALADKRWEVMYLPTVFVVSRYDLKLIRDSIMGVEQEGEDSLEELNPHLDRGSDPIFGSGQK